MYIRRGGGSVSQQKYLLLVWDQPFLVSTRSVENWGFPKNLDILMLLTSG